MKQQYEVFSIESRKGGVGKTTMALNLAKALIGKGYKVLYIDCDISGTPVSTATEHSMYWSKYANAMHDKDGKPSNLLQLFRTKYQTSEVEGDRIIDDFVIDEKKINLIESDIYDEERRLIIDPRNLMDEMTSYWLLNMIKQISESFSKKSLSKSAIVIDNSPGYVGLAKSIRDWMTSLGPEYAHFLLVSSLDEQDFSSVVSSAEEIYNLMQSKWEIAKDSNTKDIDELSKYDSSLGQFYYSVNADYKYPSLNIENIDITSYIAIVFNKTPESLIDDNVTYSVIPSDYNDRKMILEKLIPQNSNGFPINTIGYDSLVSEQFMSSRIVVAGDNGAKDKHYSAEAFLKKKSYAESLRYEFNKVQILMNFEKSYRAFINNLAKDGYVALSRTFKNLYTPANGFIRLYASVSEISRFPMKLNGIDSNSNDSIRTYDRIFIEDFLSRKGLKDYSDYFLSLVDNLHQKTGSRRKKQSMLPVVNLSFMLKLFCAVQSVYYNEENSYEDFLREEYRVPSCKVNDLFSYLGNGSVSLTEDYSVDYQQISMLANKCFIKFYKSMCYSLLRMIDGITDYLLVLAVFQKTLDSNYPRVMNKPMKDYIRAVVIDKTQICNPIVFEDVTERPFEMQEIQSLITNNILSKWLMK